VCSRLLEMADFSPLAKRGRPTEGGKSSIFEHPHPPLTNALSGMVYLICLVHQTYRVRRVELHAGTNLVEVALSLPRPQEAVKHTPFQREVSQNETYGDTNGSKSIDKSPIGACSSLASHPDLRGLWRRWGHIHFDSPAYKRHCDGTLWYTPLPGPDRWLASSRCGYTRLPDHPTRQGDCGRHDRFGRTLYAAPTC
jgi:hypothetical protein